MKHLGFILIFGAFLIAPARSSVVLVKLTYDEAVAQGLKANAELFSQRFQIPISEAEALTAGIWSNPSLYLDSQLNPLGTAWNQTSSGGPTQLDFVLSVPLDISGKRSKARAAAKAATQAIEADFQNAVRVKILEIRSAYVDLLTLRQQVILLREKVSGFARLVKTLESRIGNSRLLPLLQTRALLARDQANVELERREADLVGVQSNLLALLGLRPSQSEFEPLTGLRDFKIKEELAFEELLKRAFERRPDLQSLGFAKTKTSFDIRTERARVWDDFTLSAGVSRQGDVQANPASSLASLPGAWSWIAGLTIPLPVFNRNPGGIRKAELLAEQTDSQILGRKLSIEAELWSIFSLVQLNRRQIQNYESSQLQNARTVRDAAQRLFGTGSSSFLEYLDAINTYQTTLANYYTLVGDYRKSAAALNAAVGEDVIE